MNGGTITWKLDADPSSFNSAMSSAESRASSAATNVSGSLDRIDKQFNSAMTSLGNNLQTVGRNMSLFVTAPVVAGFGIAVKSASDFQNQMSQLGVISGASASQMVKLSNTAQALGRDTSLAGVTASDAAAAMTELSKAGLSVNDTIGASRAVLTLAKAGQMDFGSAATFTAAAMNAFKISGDKAITVADTLANGANASQASLADLALGMQQSSSVASLFGLTLQDNVTALSIFANNGIRASDAGTSLKSMLLSIATPSKQAADQMKAMGFNAYDANGKFEDLGTISLRLQKSLKGMTDQQKQTALGIIFGSDAIRSASILAANAGSNWDDMSKKIARTGTAAEVANAQYGPFRKALEGLKNNVSQLGLDVGNILMPPLTALFKSLTGLVQAFNNLPTPVQAVFVGLGLIVAAIGPMLLGFAGVVKMIMFYRNTMIELQTILKTSAVAQGVLNAVMAAAPYVLIVLAIIAVVAAFVILYKNVDGFRNFFQAVWKDAGVVVTAAVNVIKTVVKSLEPIWSGVVSAVKFAIDAILAYWGGFKTGVMDVITFLKPAIKIITGTFGDIFKSLGSIGSQIGQAFQPVLNVVGPIFQKIGSIIMTVFGAIGDFFNQHKALILGILAAIGIAVGVLFAGPLVVAVGIVIAAFKLISITLGFVADHFNTIKDVVLVILAVAFSPLILAIGLVVGAFMLIRAAIPVVVSIFQTLVAVVVSVGTWFVNMYNTIVSVMATILGVITTAWTAIWTVIDTITHAIWLGIQAVWNVIATVIQYGLAIIIGIVILGFQGIWNVISLALQGILLIVTTIWNLVWGVISTVLNAILSVVSSVWNVIWGVISAVMGFIITVITNDWNFIVGVVTAVVGFILGVISNVWNAISNVIGVVMNFIKTVITNDWNFIYGIVSSVVSAVWGVISSIFNTISGFISSIWNSIKGTITGAVNAVWSTISSVFNSVLSTVRSIWGSISGAVSSAISNVVSTVSSIKDKVVSAVSGAGQWLVSTGRDIVNGLINGIKGMAGALAGAVKTFVQQNVPEPVRKLLHINSPSKVFAEIGQYTMQGFQVGIEKSGPKVASTMKSTFGDLVSTANAHINDINSSIGNGISMDLRDNISGASSGGQNIYNITLPNVQNADDFAREFRLATQGRV